MQEKTYRLNGKKIPTSILAFFASGFLLFVFDMFIFKPIPNDTFAINMVIVAILTIGITILTFFLHKDRFIKVCADGIDVIAGKDTRHYDFADFEGTDVVKHYTNGIYTNTTRHIKLNYREKNKILSVNCSALKPAEFDELISYLSKNEFEQAEKTEATERYFDNEKYFDINKDELCARKKKNSTILIVTTLVIAVVLAVFFLAVIFSVSPAIAIVFALVTAIIAGAVTALAVRSLKKYPDSVPSKITIDNYIIGIDGLTIDREKVVKIVMTPIKYNDKDRTLEIFMRDGTKHKYNFGKLTDSDKTTYTDYPSLYNNIKLWCLQRNISFMASLS